MSSSPRAIMRLGSCAFLTAFLLTATAAAPVSARPIGDIDPQPERTVVEVAAGDTLEGLLRELGFKDELLVEVVLGFSAELDPSTLRPGHRLEVVWSDREALQAERIVLLRGDESIQLHTSGAYRVESSPQPEVEWAERALSVTVENTLIGSLEKSGAPGGLGLNLASALKGVVDFSRDVKGGETVEVLFREEVLSDGTRGRTELRYARLEIGGRKLEIAAGGEEGAPLQLFQDGEATKQSSAPVLGARISSLFGTRKHPVLGVVRMHSGVDYAASTGTPVLASAPGTVKFMGMRGGYGNIVEVQHDDSLLTRYAHLSAFAKGLKVGQAVGAGEQIGAVGATGIATGPHLHYEVRYAGKPVDPLTDERVPALAGPVAAEPAEDVLKDFRAALAKALKSNGRVASSRQS